VDGNLTNNWPAMPEAKIPTPADHACYAVPADDPGAVTAWPDPTDCSAGHTVETLHVGTFAGADADRSSPPLAGDPGRHRAYDECAVLAAGVLGGDWRTGRLELILNTPISPHWEAGARWFRCDLVEYDNLREFKPVSRTASLKDALTGARAVALSCFNLTAKGDEVETIVPVDCGAGHNAEFGGVYDAPEGPYISDDNLRADALDAGCRAVLAAYAGIPNDSNFLFRTGFVTSGFGKEYWELGNRGARCYLWLPKQFTRSVKGVGAAGLPVN
jgi:hypothetical protein